MIASTYHFLRTSLPSRGDKMRCDKRMLRRISNEMNHTIVYDNCGHDYALDECQSVAIECVQGTVHSVGQDSLLAFGRGLLSTD